ncbi:MAG: YhbY family RNA-binding protein [Candidatus Thermoplasmatota archaeon]
MDKLNNKQIQEKRAAAQQIDVTLHVGKGGINDATVAELDAQLKKKKLVKVRLLKSATEGGAQDDSQATILAQSTRSTLIEVRGHTAVFFRA